MRNLAEMDLRRVIVRAIKSPATRVAGVGLLTTAIAGACSPDQVAQLQKVFPCEPGPNIATAAGDTDTSSIKENTPITVPSFLTNGQELTICFPTGEDLVTGEPTPKPREIVRHTGPQLVDTDAPKGGTVKSLEKKMIEEINGAYKNPIDPEAVGRILPFQSETRGRETVESTLEQCTKKPKGNIARDPEEFCLNLFDGLFAIQLVTGDQNFYDAAICVRDYYHERWPDLRQQFNTHVQDTFPKDLALTIKDF